MTERFASRFNLRWTSLIFFFLSIGSVGLFMMIWVWKMANKLGTEMERSTNRILAILVICFYGWSLNLGLQHDIRMIYYSTAYAVLLIIADLIYIAGIVIGIILSFRFKSQMEADLARNGTPVHMNGFLTFIIPFFYQYYVAYNAEEISMRQRQSYVPPMPGQGYPPQGFQGQNFGQPSQHPGQPSNQGYQLNQPSQVGTPPTSAGNRPSR